MNRAKKYRKEANFKTDRDFIKYVLRCANNIAESKAMQDKYGLIPPMLQLFKLRQETTVYLKETEEEVKKKGGEK